MALGVVVLISGMAVISLIALIFLVWGIKNGQFSDVESPKYKMMEDIEPEPWPHQQGGEND